MAAHLNIPGIESAQQPGFRQSIARSWGRQSQSIATSSNHAQNHDCNDYRHDRNFCPPSSFCEANFEYQCRMTSHLIYEALDDKQIVKGVQFLRLEQVANIYSKAVRYFYEISKGHVYECPLNPRKISSSNAEIGSAFFLIPALFEPKNIDVFG